jgi:hypothetical protein
MKRRTFVVGLAGAAGWPLVARAQQRIQAVGLLGGVSLEGPMARSVEEIRQGLIPLP